MSCYFTRLRVGHPKPLTAPTDGPKSWKIYTICAERSSTSCLTRKDVAEILSKSQADGEAARKSYIDLLYKANTGRPLSDLYDEKKCHEAHSFKYENRDVKIFRIWGTGTIRIYFIYLEDRKIILLKTKPKRTDSLTKGEKEEIERLAKKVMDFISNTEFSELEI